MLIWFMIASAVALGILIYCIFNDNVEYIPLLLVTWFLIVRVPSVIHISRTEVKEVQDWEYQLYITSPYSALLLTDLKDSDPDAKKITNAYLLYKIQQGEYRVVKHVHYDMWGSKSAAPVEYFVLAK